MINVKIIKKEDFIKSIFIDGHANMAQYGYDIVCAGVSTLAYSLINYFEEVLEIEKSELNFVAIENEESSIFSINVENECIYKDERVNLGFKFFEIGIKSLVNSYGKYIELKYREV